ncbi:monooxygenase ptmN [Trichoderma asperellum]|uniref:Monooxygenase ptmN n=1 Tax=Trichoderma asperellum TaxID=101201 RepID=A0A6V8QRC1_TRIAP|nr:monooxygenase ptmN [Trichoderma asperellum]
MRVAIIGGGPSGIVQLKTLTEAHRRFPVPPFEVRLFESQDRLGGIFSSHTYEEGELVSSKYLTAFSDFRARSDDADFFATDRYLEYLDDYATNFELWPYIHLNTWVKSVRRGGSREHIVTYRTSTCEEVEWECDAIAVCSGVHAAPNIPDLPGIEHVPVVMHSSEFKSREQFGKGKTVVRVPGQRFLPWLFGSKPYEYPQLPLDVSQITLFDSMYVHPILSLCSSNAIFNTLVFFNKAWQRISNHVSTPWRPTKWPLATRIRRFFFNTDIPPASRIIEVAPTPSHISKDGVAHFPHNGRPESDRINETVVKPDVVVFATGYLPSFPFLNTPDHASDKPYPTAWDADVRQIWNSDEPTVGFIGFIRPGFGAIPPLAEMQSMLFTMNLINRIPKPLNPDDEWHYRIIHPPDARVFYGVEHDSYAYQLAKDIGPWKWDGAGEVMTGELWETIQRREGLFGNIPLSIIPMIYLGLVNLLFLWYALFWGFLAKLRLARPTVIRNEPKRIMQEMEQLRR